MFLTAFLVGASSTVSLFPARTNSEANCYLFLLSNDTQLRFLINLSSQA